MMEGNRREIDDIQMGRGVNMPKVKGLKRCVSTGNTAGEVKCG